MVQATLAHNAPGSGVEAAAPMDFALRVCDGLTGLIIAAV